MTDSEPKAAAMVLAAGLGSRLRPLTTSLPKPCVPFINEPLLFRSLRVLGNLGFDDVVVNTAYQADVLTRICAEAPPEIPNILLSVEEERLGTGGGVARAKHFFQKGKDVLILNGDVVSGMDLSQLLQAHTQSSAWATLAVFRNLGFPEALHKVAFDEEGRVEAVAGVSSTSSKVGPPIAKAIYTGTMVMSPEFIEALPTDREACLKEDGFWPGLRGGKDIRVVEIPGYWSDIGTPLRYLETHGEWIKDCRFQPGKGFVTHAPHVYVHETAIIEEKVTFQGPVVVGAHARVGANSHLSGVVCLGNHAIVTPTTSLKNVVVWDEQIVPSGKHEAMVFWSGGALKV